MAVVLVDTATQHSPSAELLQEVHGLTPAESRLAARLAMGESLEVIASALRISTTTARNQLRAVFGKTNTHRQGELVALLARSAQALRL